MQRERLRSQLPMRGPVHPAADRLSSANRQRFGPGATTVHAIDRPRIWTPAAVSSLQRAVGNRAVTSLLQPRAAASHPRASKQESAPIRPRGIDGVTQQPPSTAQRTGSIVVQLAPRSAAVRALETRMPAMQSNARLLAAHADLGEAYVNLSVGVTDLLSTKLRIFSLNYQQAYNAYANVIGQGRAEAQNQTLWRGIFLGIGTGVLAGIGAAWIAPSTFAGWFALTAADLGTAAGSSLLQSLLSSSVAYALSDAIAARGSDMQPGGLSPDMLQSNIWRHVASMYRGSLATTRVLANLHKNNVAAERVIAEMRVLIARGASDFTPEDVAKAADTLNGRMDAMRPVFEGLVTKSNAMRTFTDAVTSYNPDTPSVEQMERDIWIMWIGSLSDDDSDILDLDAIENHLKQKGILGSGGTLGVDFEGYTSKEDELAAIAAARGRAAAVRGQYDQAASRWTTPVP